MSISDEHFRKDTSRILEMGGPMMMLGRNSPQTLPQQPQRRISSSQLVKNEACSPFGVIRHLRISALEFRSSGCMNQGQRGKLESVSMSHVLGTAPEAASLLVFSVVYGVRIHVGSPIQSARVFDSPRHQSQHEWLDILHDKRHGTRLEESFPMECCTGPQRPLVLSVVAPGAICSPTARNPTCHCFVLLASGITWGFLSSGVIGGSTSTFSRGCF
ncbi:hypothetical protein ACQKWADRAFT_190724 [Trichoderma austrokoningii]